MIRDVLEEFEQRLLKAEDLAFKDVDLVYEEKDKALADTVIKLKQLFLEMLGKDLIIPKKEWESMNEAQISYVMGRNQMRADIRRKVESLE